MGVIGWRVFSISNLFLDLGDSLIAFADSVEILKQNGYGELDFIKIPLLLDRGLVELQAESPEGPLRCVLDTGSSASAIHRDLKEGQTLEQAMKDNISNDLSLTIGGKNFGPILFFHFPIESPLKVDAILGMEFLKEHVLFLDFAEGYAYLSKKDCVKQASSVEIN